MVQTMMDDGIWLEARMKEHYGVPTERMYFMECRDTRRRGIMSRLVQYRHIIASNGGTIPEVLTSLEETLGHTSPRQCRAEGGKLVVYKEENKSHHV